jgi:hypothetical protein
MIERIMVFGLTTATFAAFLLGGTWKLAPAELASMWENRPAKTRRLQPSLLTTRQWSRGQHLAGLYDAKCSGASQDAKVSRSAIHHVRGEPQEGRFQ